MKTETATFPLHIQGRGTERQQLRRRILPAPIIATAVAGISEHPLPTSQSHKGQVTSTFREQGRQETYEDFII